MTAIAPAHLFITGVLTGLIAGFTFRRMVGRSGSGDGSGEIRLMEERLLKADQGLFQFRQQLKAQSSELRAAQQQAKQTSEQAALSRTQSVQCSRTFDSDGLGVSGALDSHQRVWQGKVESCGSAVSSTNRSNSAWAASMRSNGSRWGWL